MKTSPLMFVLCSVLVTANCAAYTKELFDQSKRDNLVQLIQSIYDKNPSGTDAALFNEVPVNVQMGTNKDTALMITLKRLKGLKKYKSRAGYVALASGGLFLGLSISSIALMFFGPDSYDSDVVEDIMGIAMPLVYTAIPVSALTSLTSFIIFIRKGSVRQLAQVAKEIIKYPLTDISIKNAEGKTALDLTYEILEECGPSQDVADIERLLVYRAHLKK